MERSGRGASDGDSGGGRERDKDEDVGKISNAFVFGSGNSERGDNGKENETVMPGRRIIPPSYRDKLLSLSCSGYLVKHDEKEDIVNGWKSFFAKKNAGTGCSKMQEEGDDADASDHHGGGGCVKGKYPVLSVTAEQYTAWCQPWLNSLIIKVLGASAPKAMLIDRVKRMWKPQKPMKVVPLSNDYYIVSFSSRDDRDYAYQEGPWMIDDHYLLVQRWRPNFNPWKADTQRNIAAWIRIPDIPVEFYNVESLWMIGNMVGKTIKVDRSTSIYDKGSFARICVEIDLLQPLLPAFTAFGEDRQIVYEGLHQVCFECGLYGHEKHECPTLKETMVNEQDTEKDGAMASEQIVKEPQTWTDAVPQTQNPATCTVTPTGTGHLGPQMLVRRDFRKGFTSTEKKGSVGDKLWRNHPDIKNKKEDKGISKKTGLQKTRNEEISGANFTRTKMVGKEANLNKGSEWVPVGAKRKNDGKVQNRDKGNKPIRKFMLPMKKHVGPKIMYNSFTVLQENMGLDINLQNQDTCTIGPLMEDMNVQLQEENQVAMAAVRRTNGSGVECAVEHLIVEDQHQVTGPGFDANISKDNVMVEDIKSSPSLSTGF